ncbi:serine--tRNA ligase [Mycoplasmopsis opalescens]|uniref:serine--tRNA ligase n=1 Tax=Mycoplasmopsis opalescens TaxID=114886 RepID=UPI0004A77422|nr:serine--tRNA ligase [Mycoplasmopsis opalescens]
MLNLKAILANKNLYRQGLINKGVDAKLFDELYDLATERGTLMYEAQQKKSELGKISKLFGSFKNNPAKLNEIKSKSATIKAEFNKLQEKAELNTNRIDELLNMLPNIPAEDVIVGADENENKVLKTHDKLGRGLVRHNKHHYEIANELGILDTERGVKLAGSRFVLYKGYGAKLARAIQNFLLDLHEKDGYIEYSVPVLNKPNILYGTGQLPKFKEDLYEVNNGEWYLIPTAEVPLTNIYNNEIIDLTNPLRFTAFTECFRSEAGSGGKDTKGIIRLHQFKKVELVKICSIKDAEAEFKQLWEQATKALKILEIPFRELMLCTGDLGFSSHKTIDLEVWLPSDIQFREISSISHMGDFQSRRAMIRYKDENGESQYAHTMNASGVAIDRLIAAILENYYNEEEGSVSVPKALIPYMGIKKITKQ